MDTCFVHGFDVFVPLFCIVINTYKITPQKISSKHMKNTAKLLAKGLLIIVLFTGSTIALSSAGVKTVSEANAAVSYEYVYQYLVNRGYQVITLNPAGGTYKTENWTAHTVRQGTHYTTTVFVSGNEIIQNTDVIM
jgi:hypothetical protein